MKISRTACALLGAAAIVLFPGCQSVKRVGKDLAIVGTCWATIPLGGVRDALDWGKSTKDAFPMVLAPVTVPGHIIKHAAWTLCYAGDLVLSPFYLLASIFHRPGLDPIELYSLTDGYPWKAWPVPEWED